MTSLNTFPITVQYKVTLARLRKQIRRAIIFLLFVVVALHHRQCGGAIPNRKDVSGEVQEGGDDRYVIAILLRICTSDADFCVSKQLYILSKAVSEETSKYCLAVSVS